MKGTSKGRRQLSKVQAETLGLAPATGPLAAWALGVVGTLPYGVYGVRAEEHMGRETERHGGNTGTRRTWRRGGKWEHRGIRNMGGVGTEE